MVAASSESWRAEPASEPCRAQLRALAEGRLAGWTGFAGCRRIDVEAALGAGSPWLNPRGDLGELALGYPAQPAAPRGLIVWYRGTTATAALLNPVALAVSPDELLGKPELVRPSRVNEGMEEWIWASRGAAAQVAPLSLLASSIMAFAPMSVEEFLTSPLGR